MKIDFACPSCGVSGSAEMAYAGKAVRCKQCQHRFLLPNPGEPESEVYSLDEPTEATGGGTAWEPDRGPASAFVPSRGDEPTTFTAPDRAKRQGSGTGARIASRREPEIARRTWLLPGAGIVAVVVAATALIAPRGTLIAGCTLMALGSGMVLAGYA